MKTRSSNIELLRVLALLGVVIIHYTDRTIPIYSEHWHNFDLTISIFFRSLVSASVDIFLIISGYYMCTSDKRVIGKPLNLMLQVSVFGVLAYLVSALFGVCPLSMRSIVSSAIPDSYYSILFVVLYLISPYINTVLVSLSNRSWNTFILILIGCFSVLSLITPILLEFTGNVWMGTNGIGAWGSQQGFNIVNFILCYCVGAYLKLGELPKFITKREGLLWCASLFVIFGWALLTQNTYSNQLRSAWVYDNPVVLLFGALTFLLMKKIHLQSTFINGLAQLVYPMFLIHCHFMKYIKIDLYCQKPFYIMICHYICFVIVMFIITWFVYRLYMIIFKKLFSRLDHLEIPYSID